MQLATAPATIAAELEVRRMIGVFVAVLTCTSFTNHRSQGDHIFTILEDRT